jgi:type IV pilus assembly protein PilZ
MSLPSGVSMSQSGEPVPSPTRAHERYQVTIPVDCSTRHVFISNHVSNISKGGLFLRSDKPLPLDAEVSLVLRLPDTGASIRATGRVVWNYDMQKGTSRIVPGTGIRFIDMSLADRAALEAYLERLPGVADS